MNSIRLNLWLGTILSIFCGYPCLAGEGNTTSTAPSSQKPGGKWCLFNTCLPTDKTKLKPVKGIGTGETHEQALQNAYQHAIQTALGAVVDSETLVRNGQVIKDEILVYSRGFVGSHRVVSAKKNSDGNHEVVIQAKVSELKLYDKIRQFQPGSTSVEGADIFGAVVSRMESRKRGIRLLEKTLSSNRLPLSSLLKVELVGRKPRIAEEDTESALAEWQVRVSFDRKLYGKQIYPMLKQLLSKVSTAKKLSVKVKADSSRGAAGYPFGKFRAHSHHHAYFIDRSLPREWDQRDVKVYLWKSWGLFGSKSSQSYDIFWIPAEAEKAFSTFGNEVPDLVLELMDKDKNPIILEKLSLIGARDVSGWRIGSGRFIHSKSHHNKRIIAPTFLLNAATMTMQESYISWIKEDVVITWKVRVPLDTMRKVKHVACRIGAK